MEEEGYHCANCNSSIGYSPKQQQQQQRTPKLKILEKPKPLTATVALYQGCCHTSPRAAYLCVGGPGIIVTGRASARGAWHWTAGGQYCVVVYLGCGKWDISPGCHLKGVLGADFIPLMVCFCTTGISEDL